MSYKNKDTIGQYINLEGANGLAMARANAISYIHDRCNTLTDDISKMFKHIWYASTVMLPHLEVQVVIDSNDMLHVSTGSSGYVDFGINPIGMKLPIKCWIHTHPFGAAYFSSVDWKTVNTWLPLMQEAFVLGGEHHYGYWTNEYPDMLHIMGDDNRIRIQKFSRGEEE